MKLSETERSGVAALARWSIAHRWTVIVAWLVLALAGAAAAQSDSRLSFAFDLPGQPAYETNERILDSFGSGGSNAPLIVVARLPEGGLSSPQAQSELHILDERVRRAVPGARTASAVSDPAGAASFVSKDGRTTFAMVYPVPDFTSADPYSKALPAIEDALSAIRVGGEPVRITGASVLAAGGSSSSTSVLVETILAGVAALVVLAIVFGSLLALLPLLIAAIAIPTTFVGIYALTYATTMSTLVQNIVALVGLGVAIDYALLVVTRWREERAAGRSNRDAVLASASTAGSSVVFSGITVTVSLAALALTNVPFLRSIGLAGMLIPLISVAVSITLLPVILDAAGSRLEWPRKRPPTSVSRMWTTIAAWVVRHRIAGTAGSLALIAALIIPGFSLQLGQPQAAAQATTASAQASAGLQALTDSGIGAGVLRPTEVVLPAGRSLTAPDGITLVRPAAWNRDGIHVAAAWSSADASTDAGEKALTQLQAAANVVPGAQIGGSPAQDRDFIDALYGSNLWIIIAVITVVTFLLLSRALHSIWLPVKALLLNAISLAAAFGVLTLIWQEGHGSGLFSSPATGAITLWVPLAVFALLFGLSMDYEVFILTRINEEYAAGHTADRAVIRGIGHTGRLVSSGALILVFAFVALGGVPQTDVKILSTGLAAGIVIDATIIRGVLAPALVSLLGHLNWWLPRRVQRILRIAPIRPQNPPSSSPRK
ncbi:MMPL family transporter [Streptomyces cadmiisoli]|uniref:MMPL family transporter n=1 Tax=Streptomyces cadmiisoli TaxID=2184053 RepID=UPI0018F03B34|nr:MMPL family transporter [Streptomyces cadmiisoli]